MLVLITSPAALLDKAKMVDHLVVEALSKLANTNPVGIVSNHEAPAWLTEAIKGTKIQFRRVQTRQNGSWVKEQAKHFDMPTYNFVCLTATDADYKMGKNAGAILVAAGWSEDAKAQSLGVRVADAGELLEIFNLCSGWDGNWWFKADGRLYDVRALADLSSYGPAMDQAEFAQKLTEAVKRGGGPLNALLAITARSMVMEWGLDRKNLLFGVYPSSSPSNYNNEVLTEFTHRLRTTISRVHHASRYEPLFVRHSASQKRSKGHGGNRLDPKDQVTTIHLNPFYKKALPGKHVIVVDDCTTYGLSFGVASAFLKAAGAKSMTGLALGKFGGKIESFSISITSDPFAPVSINEYNLVGHSPLDGVSYVNAQHNLKRLIP